MRASTPAPATTSSSRSRWDLSGTRHARRLRSEGLSETGIDRAYCRSCWTFSLVVHVPPSWSIEDSHWADEATLDAIRFIGRRIAVTNGLLLLTYRDGEVDHDHPLRGVIGDIPAQSMVKIQLGGLSLMAVAALVADSGQDPADVHVATHGNPFLVREMTSAADGSLPASLYDSVMARVRKLNAAPKHASLPCTSCMPGSGKRTPVACSRTSIRT